MIWRAITVQQPWAGMLFGYAWGSHSGYGYKRIENRRWRTSYRGPLLIHAASRVDPDMSPGLWAEPNPVHPSAALASIIGLVELVDTDNDSANPWSIEGHYHWRLENPRLLAEPIPHRGQQSIWTVRDPQVLASLVRQLGAVGDSDSG